jgi:hypothetical protein
LELPTVIAPKDDLRAVIEAGFQGLLTTRDDAELAHVSDCYGCDRATWERRQGFEPAQRDPEACLKMQLGNDIERYVCDALQAYYETQGFSVQRDVPIIWNPHDGRGMAQVANEATSWVTNNALVGHMDFHAKHPEHFGDVVLECKSTSFFRGKVPTEPRPHYVEQTAGYGIATGASNAGIIIVCRESCRIAGPFWLDLDALEAETIERAKAVIELTGSCVPPAANPRYSWQPKYCSMGAACACIAAKNNTAAQLEASLK